MSPPHKDWLARITMEVYRRSIEAKSSMQETILDGTYKHH